VWDIYVRCAERYHWTPDQVQHLDPDFVAELLLYWRAESDDVQMKAKIHGD
jgi:hypothetical protein